MISKDDLGRIVSTHLQPVIQHITNREVLTNELERAQKSLDEAKALVDEITSDIAEYDKLTGGQLPSEQTIAKDAGEVIDGVV